MVDRSQKTVVAPVVEIPAHRGDRRKVVRQHPPLTARGGHVQYGVEHIAQIRRARAASGLRRGSNGAIWHHSRSEEHTSELQSLMRISYAVFCLKKKKTT